MKKPFPSPGAAVLLVAGLVLAEVVAGAALQDFRKALDLHDADVESLAVVLGTGLALAIGMQLADLRCRELFAPPHAVSRRTQLAMLPLLLALVPGVLAMVFLLVELLAAGAPPLRVDDALAGRQHAASVAALLSLCVLAPVLQEMLFRGLVLRGFLGRLPRWGAIALSAALSGATHLEAQPLLFGLMLGVVLGWLYARTRALLPCIVLHAACNAALLWQAGRAQSLDAGVCALMLAVSGLAWFALRRSLQAPPRQPAGTPLPSRL